MVDVVDKAAGDSTDGRDWLLQRRQRLIDKLGDDSIIVLFSSSAFVNSYSDNFGSPLFPDSDFFYLTDYVIVEPETFFVLTGNGWSALYTDAFRPEVIKWSGYATTCNTPERLSQQLRLSTVGSVAEGWRQLATLLPRFQRYYTNFNFCFPAQPHPRLQQLAQELAIKTNNTNDNSDSGLHNSTAYNPSDINPPPNAIWQDIHAQLASLRVIKDAEELSRIRQAATLANQAITYLTRRADSHQWEYQLAADFHYYLLNQQAGPSFPTIVAQGARAGMMHYQRLDGRLVVGQQILIDAGCRYQGYCSDLSRVISYQQPFTTWQKEVYYWVEQAQQSVIAMIKPGVSWRQLQQQANRRLAQGLQELGILHASMEQIMDQQLFKPYTVHSIGHWLGIDVHDSGDYQQLLAPGMVLTVEPGLYLTAANTILYSTATGITNINMRLEEDVVVTDEGGVLLS